MSVTFSPHIALRLLSEVQPGSFVLEPGKRRGFCCVGERGGGTHVMVALASDGGSFQYHPAPDLEVLDFGSELIVTPDLETIDATILATSANTELFLQGNSPKIAFRVQERGLGWRFLDLHTGVIGTPMHSIVAFKKWSISVKTPAGPLIRLFDVGPLQS
jgi:hypothetical protein